ncbi:YdeI/OmpD-associated family protein [Terrimonas sp. NA20]|uniref:YdeI/OmpD-associated family protein n=1 Tax=Terrimonas ginsenosidimutans TaxID=2908004 RepID=A0ABS9KQQ0_9BACT|nr:YdeI/OmpD-associated family protein [Terrimonas ginsenosidimutans]MCG2614652.1 YdeI/OmpD-associated family protein [Terrimonas ginsenosidimutans]
MVTAKDTEVFYPANAKEWRQWLQKNHRSKQSVWVIYYKKKANHPTVTHSEAVDEALCFGWIDSTRVSLGDDQFKQFFCKRKPTSVWSKINKAKVQKLIDEKKMMPAGWKSIETAKENESWSILDDVEELKIPADLSKAFRRHAGSKAFFNSLSKSVKKMMLQWLVLAKREETREKRLEEIASNAAAGQRPKPFR